MNKYIKYLVSRGKFSTEFQFVESKELPKDIPISTPLTFPFLGRNIVLVKKTMVSGIFLAEKLRKRKGGWIQ